MSDTPRTEAEVNRTDSCPMAGVVTVDANFACQLERELNAANARITRLEVAGDVMEWGCIDPESVREWRKAKEAKP